MDSTKDTPCEKRVGLFNGQHRHRGPCVEEGAPVTRPVGVLDPAPPKGCSCVERLVRFCQIVDYCKTTGHPGRITGSSFFPPTAIFVATWHQLGSILVQLGRLVRHVRPSCPTWLLLGSNLVHLCSNLAQLSANLAQLGPILAQLGSILVQFWSQLGPTWSQNLTNMNLKTCFLASPADVQFCTDF